MHNGGVLVSAIAKHFQVLCGLPPYVVCERLIRGSVDEAGGLGTTQRCGIYSACRNAMSPVSSRQRFAGLSSCTSQSASALAFISRSTFA